MWRLAMSRRRNLGGRFTYSYRKPSWRFALGEERPEKALGQSKRRRLLTRLQASRSKRREF